jgi:hypothetical protein
MSNAASMWRVWWELIDTVATDGTLEVPRPWYVELFLLLFFFFGFLLVRTSLHPSTLAVTSFVLSMCPMTTYINVFPLPLLIEDTAHQSRARSAGVSENHSIFHIKTQ